MQDKGLRRQDNKKSSKTEEREEKRRQEKSDIKDEMLSADNPFTPKHTLGY